MGGNDLWAEECRGNVLACYQFDIPRLIGGILEVYIDNVVVKSVGFSEHLADLRVLFERVRKYKLKMNPMKCAFCVLVGKFLGFVVHESGIQIDEKKIESIKKLKELVCKRGVQKLPGKINYLRRFISNLASKVESFLPLIRLKHEGEFMWGAEQREAFEKIKQYLTSPPVLKAPKAGEAFRLYIAAQEHVIGIVLMQQEDGKEFVVAYLSRRLVDAETRYEFVEKLCLSLYYVCTKLRHYLLSSICNVVC
jgi:hypothetical protein